MNTPTEQQLNIIISPHLDDAVFSLGGFMAQHPDATAVITVFCGAPAQPASTPWDRRSGFSDSAQAMRERIIENETALSILGVSPGRIRNLLFPDIQYRTLPHPAVFGHSAFDAADRAALERALLETVQQLISEHAPAVTAVYVPITQFHPDHRIVRDTGVALRDRLAQIGVTQFFMYQDLPYAYFAFLKKAALSLHRTKTVISRLPQLIAPALGKPNERIAIPVSDAAFGKKIAASKAYRSQIKGIYRYFIWVPALFGRLQANYFRTKAPYCEVVYDYSHGRTEHGGTGR